MRVGIIGGSGLYAIDGIQDARWEEVTTPFGAPSDAFLRGTLAGAEVIFLPRHGRGHTILPGELNHRANIYGMKVLGAEAILSFTAVGSLQERYAPRDLVIVDQFFDRTGKGGQHTFFGSGVVAHIMFAEPTCARLAAAVADTAERLGGRVHRGGTYVNMEGPAFSTRAESRFYHHSGFDVIGMTNLGEARLAREAEICFATCAMVTDYDSWHEAREPVTVEMVIGHLEANTGLARRIVSELVPRLGFLLGADCPCRSALHNALLTRPELIGVAQRRALAPILGRYLDR